MKRQQEVARAIKKKIEGFQSISGLPKLFSIYNALQDHFTTDLTFSEIMHLTKIGENTETDNIIFYSITAEPEGLLVYDKIVWNGVQASVLSPRAGRENYGEIHQRISDIILGLKNLR
jgi:anionic cell wall polymer biosynthesis LytR-Cps2A-Psr (LCP) family protein